MKAAYIERPGPPQSIRYGDLPMPEMGGKSVLVKVSAVTVNQVDTYIRAGTFSTDLCFPFVIGRDMTGVVIETGKEVVRFRPGDRVWCNNQGYGDRQGTFAEYCCVDEDLLYPMPASADIYAVVAVLHSALTAVVGLCHRARLRRGETIFINGGDGNVGSAVLQLAKALGGRAIVTSANAQKAEWCRKLGADLVIDYKTSDVNQEIKRFAAGGVDVYWDATRQPDVARALEVTANRARLVLMAGLGHRTLLPVGPFYTKDCTLYGFTVTGATRDELGQYATEINCWLDHGLFKPKIALKLPLSQAAIAHHLQETSTLVGKIVLSPEWEPS
jgi:NADPH:quinone reductase